MTVPRQLARKAIAMPVAAMFLALAPAGAWGVADVIKNSGNNFDKSTYYSDEGDLVRFEHTGGAPHNVTSTQFSGGERLFSSATIKSGSTAVNGTESLSPGTYPFICTIHDNMAAALVVRESAAPPPAPGPGPAPGEPGPGPGPLTLELGAKKQELTKKLKFFATSSADSTLVAGGSVKQTTVQLAADEKTKVKAKLNRSARERLEEKLDRSGKAKAKVKATATDQRGATATDKVKVKLKD